MINSKQSFERFMSREFVKYSYGMFSTVTVSPYDHKCDSVFLLELAIKQLFDKYKHVKACLYAVETSSSGKVHMHGVISHTNTCKWAKVRKHPLYHFDIDPLNKGSEWFEYCLKDKPRHLYLISRGIDVRGKSTKSIIKMNIGAFAEK